MNRGLIARKLIGTVFNNCAVTNIGDGLVGSAPGLDPLGRQWD
jgi:hypothetical protein